MNIRIDDDKPQMMVWVFENVEDNTSVIMVKGHHYICDGISYCLHYMKADTRGLQKDDLPPMMKTTFVQRCVMMFATPFLTLNIIRKGLFFPKANNPMAGKPLSGIRTGHQTKVYNFTKLRALAKKRGMTYNDLFLVISSNVLKEYFED